jgi:dTDP-4-dehydrorhamnose reductase
VKVLLFGASGMLVFALHRVLRNCGYDVAGVLHGPGRFRLEVVQWPGIPVGLADIGAAMDYVASRLGRQQFRELANGGVPGTSGSQP